MRDRGLRERRVGSAAEFFVGAFAAFEFFVGGSELDVEGFEMGFACEAGAFVVAQGWLGI